MIIRHSLPNKCYTKIDRYVFTNKELSDGAKVLYGYLCGLRNGANFTDAYLVEALVISQAALARRKRELVKADLIHTDQVAARVYVIYIGYTNMPALTVKQQWVNEDNVH